MRVAVHIINQRIQNASQGGFNQQHRTRQNLLYNCDSSSDNVPLGTNINNAVNDKYDRVQNSGNNLNNSQIERAE